MSTREAPSVMGRRTTGQVVRLPLPETARAGRPELLLLVHRIPYPPNKGDKIRSFHLLRHLSAHYRIHLGAFVDDPADWRHREAVAAWCASLQLLPLPPRRARLRSLAGLRRGVPLTLPYYRDPAMARWVAARLEAGVERLLVFSSAMAQYLPPEGASRRRAVVDFVDVDSDKWRQYAAGCRQPMRWLYRREARTLLDWERRLAADCAASVFVSAEEAALFRQLAPESASRIHAIDNGVDTDYFSPGRVYANPYPDAVEPLVFTGAMDYRANIDAVSFFASEVLPQVRRHAPQVRFFIVGTRPAAAVRRLAARAGVEVTGAVPDVRPYLAHARAAVAPLRIARGVQNKVLEAMAMGCPVIATPQAVDGLCDCPDGGWRVAETPEALARLCVEVVREAPPAGAGGRDCVLRNYSWSEHMGRMVALLERLPAGEGRPCSS